MACRSVVVGLGGGLAGALLLAWSALSEPSRVPTGLEVVATGVPRPLQLVADGASIVVLSPGAWGDASGEIYRFDATGELPVDLSRQPRVRIPFIDARVATLGSLTLNPLTRELFLGEENGTAIYRLDAEERLTLYATGLHRLGGGSTVAFDHEGRLVILDYVDPRLSPADERPLPGLEQFREEDYRGPLVFRLSLDASIPLPRRLGRLAPLFPRAWGGREGGAMLPRLISVAPLDSGDLVFLTSGGEMFRLAADGRLAAFARLPRGQYNRITMVAGPDGSVLVSGGFHVGAIFRVAADGRVTLLAGHLADPEGIAVDARGDLYVAESSHHRIVRLRGAARS